ncbi:MAG: ATPase domain-containing protein, partial [Ignisphaera sp.]
MIKLNGIIFGIDALDKLFGNTLTPPSTIVVAGHPGAGKTILASTICYKNALNDNKCLYISFQEHKEKLYKNLTNLGIYFEKVEKTGNLLFTRLPIVLNVNDIVAEIHRIVESFKPKVLVIDSINTFLLSASDESRRAWLQNYFYELAKQIDGVVVLVAELPFGSEIVDLGSIEFVTDAVFILKHRVEDGRLVRIIEIRKARGSPITIAEIPFTILEKQGLKVYVPPILEDIPSEGDRIEPPCRHLANALGDIQKGHVIFISYPSIARPPEIFLQIYGFTLANKARTLVISFRISPATMKQTIIKSLQSFGISDIRIEKFIESNFVFRSYNPFAYSSTELMTQIIEVVNFVKPDIVLLHAFDIFALAYKPKHMSTIYNMVNYMKSKKILTIIMSIRANSDIFMLFSRLADINIAFKYRFLRD